MKSKIVLFIIGILVWCLLNWPIDLPHLFVGLVVSLFVSITAGGLFAKRPHYFLHWHRYLWFLYYIPLFLWECLKANIDVAYRVIHPRLPIRPGIVKVKTTLKSDTGLTFLANSITLTPGTMTVDVDRENGILYIHWINVKSEDIEESTKIIVKRFEKILKRIFE